MSKEMDAVSRFEASFAIFASYSFNSVRASWTAASSSTGLDGVVASNGEGGSVSRGCGMGGGRDGGGPGNGGGPGGGRSALSGGGPGGGPGM